MCRARTHCGIFGKAEGDAEFIYFRNGNGAWGRYISLGLKYFPQLKNSYTIGNAETIQLRKANCSIVSATLEHVEQPYELLNNVLSSTGNYFFLRTCLGDREIVRLQSDEKYASNPYFVNQFTFSKIR